MTGRTPTTAQPYGNTIDKEKVQGIEKRLVHRFNARALSLIDDIPAKRALDVGCGSGWLTALASAANPACQWIGVDRDNVDLRARWHDRQDPNVVFSAADVYALPFPDDHFDVVSIFEVLEHLDHPGAAIAECLRVSCGWLVASVPWEPIWRLGNIAKLRYVRDLGNTPGHVNHWSRRGFEQLMGWHGRVDRVQSSPPWNLVRVRKIAT
jgi:SAM-dependent methyltransferase